MSKIKIEVEISKEVIANLLCSAFDPAIHAVSYWCEIVGKISPKEYLYRIDKQQIYPYVDVPLNEGGQLILKVTEGDEQSKYFNLDLSVIQKGLEVMAEKYPEHFADIMSGNDDSATADVLIQCALFGEIIYG